MAIRLAAAFLVVLLGPALPKAGSTEPCADDPVVVKLRETRGLLRQAVRLEQDPLKRADLLFRLAENLRDEARACRESASGCSKESERVYRDILAKAAGFDRLDEVRFALAHLLWEQGDRQEALKVYHEIIRHKGKHEPEAWLAFGEYYFDGGQIDKALAAYQKVAEFEQASVLRYGLYKLGWCYYNLQHFDRALEVFRRLIEMHQSRSNAESYAGTALFEEVVQDYVLAYGHVGDAIAAADTFRRLVPDRAPAMLARLARNYAEQGRDTRAIQVYRRLLADDPCVLEAPRYRFEIIVALRRLGLREETLTEVQGLRRFFDDLLACPGWRHREHRTAFQHAIGEFDELVSDLALTWYRELPHSHPQHWNHTEEALTSYLRLFPASPRGLEVRHAHASLLFRRKRFEAAAGQYDRLFRDASGAGRSDLACQAAAGATQARHERRSPGRNPTVVDFLEAVERFQRHCPDQARRWRSERIRALLQIHHEEEAWLAAKRIAQDDRDPDGAREAAKLVREIEERAARSPGIRLGGPAVEGNLSRAVVRGVLSDNLEALENCYALALADRPDLTGWALVQFTIAANGYVATARWREHNLPGQEILACLGLALRKLRFPRPRPGGSVQVTYPMVFGPESFQDARTP